jgi:uridine phosphorylase
MTVRKLDSQSVPLIRPENLFNKLDVTPQALVVFSPLDLKLVLSHFSVVSGSIKNINFSSLHTIQIKDKTFTLAGPAIGAPVATMVLEVLICFGAYQIIALGSCGSLNKKFRIGNFIIPEKAFSDEGVSSHYPLKGKKVKPSKRIFQGLKSICQSQSQIWVPGKVWTTDALFRETPQKIKKFQQKQAIAVEMELSAFFKVGNFYGVEVGALLVVSDELFSQKWKSGYKTQLYKKSFLKAAEIVFNLLSQLE